MAGKRPLSIDDLFRLRAVGHVAISPDGRKVVFELKRFDLKQNKNFVQLMLADSETGDVRALTAEARHSDTLPRFSPDGSQLAFLSDREKPNCLWVLPMTGGEPRRITDRDGVVKDFDWSPDGRRLAYTCQPLTQREKLERDEKHDELKKQPQFRHIRRLTHKLDGVGFWNGQYTHVYVVGVDGGKPRQLSRGDYDDSEPRFSPDGRRISFVSNRTADPDRNFDQSDLYVISAAGGRLQKITRGTGERRFHSWSPDGRTIAYVGAPHKPTEWWKYEPGIWVVPSAGGKPRHVARDIDNTCHNVTLGDVAISGFDAPPPAWSPDGARLYFLVSEHGATRLFSRSLARRDTRCEIGGNINLYHFAYAPQAGRFACAIGTATNPGDVFIVEPCDRFRLHRLTHVNDELLSQRAIGEPEEFWLNNGRTRIQGWVLKPPGFNPRKKHPAILEIHGGPYAQYGCAFFHEMQMLAGRGYVVFLTNPRGSEGYGLKFRSCIIGDWGGLDYRDIRKVGDYVFSRPYVDTKRVGVTGGSYGGYMTNWVVGHEQRYRAAVTQRSCVNFESFFGTSDFGHVIAGELRGLPWKNHENLRRQSPLTYVTNIRTPLLILHSEQDLRCSIEQAEQLFVALKYLGREVEYVAFEGESHGLSRGGRPQNRAERLRRIAGWFDRHLR